MSEGRLLANAESAKFVEEIDLTDATPDTELPEYQKELYEDTCQKENLSETARIGLRALLTKHSSLFAKNDDDLGRTTLVTHDIDTGEAAPIRQPPRHVPFALQRKLETEVKRMLDAKVIEPGSSPWASPVVLIRKKDGPIHFCVDYRNLNAVMRFDAFPLPRIDKTLESLSGARYFSTLDLLSGYWQVGLTEQARLKSAFTIRSGLF